MLWLLLVGRCLKARGHNTCGFHLRIINDVDIPGSDRFKLFLVRKGRLEPPYLRERIRGRLRMPSLSSRVVVVFRIIFRFRRRNRDERCFGEPFFVKSVPNYLTKSSDGAAFVAPFRPVTPVHWLAYRTIEHATTQTN